MDRMSTAAVALLVALGSSVLASPQRAQAAATDFVSTWTVPAGNLSVTLPLYDGGTYNFTVNWGDGASGTVTTWDDPDKTRTYATAGTYTVTISGTLTGWSFDYGGDRNKIVGISQWGTFNPGSRGGAFRGCEELNISATDAPNLTLVTSLKEMFNDAKKLTTPNFSNWNTASVQNIEGMFRGATLFNGNVSTWNTSSVTGMREMFNNARAFNQPLAPAAGGVWNTSNVTGMDGMFRGAEAFNQPISGWNTANVTTMYEMFSNARAFNQDLNTWNTSSVVGNGVEGMFRGATLFNGNVTTWNTANVTTMREMFKEARAFNQSIGSWNTSRVTNMEGMFNEAIRFNGNIGSWNTSNVTTMREMFRYAEAFNQPVGAWNTGSVTNMESMFEEAGEFNQPIGSWNTGSVTNMRQMFRWADKFNQPIGSWNTSRVANMESMFEHATVFNQPLNLWDTSRVANMRQVFRFAEAFNQPIGSWTTGSALTMERMFNGAKAFNYPLEAWTTSQVTTMHKMFEEATVFNQPLGLWNTSNVTDMEQMFWLARGYNQSLAGLEVTGLTRPLGLFVTLSGMTPLNVDATLAGWAAQALPTRSIALDLGNNGGSPGNLDNNFYTQGSGSIAIGALSAKGWTVSNGNFISTADSLPAPTTATMNAGGSRMFAVLLKASGGHSYTYDSRSVLSATPTLAGASTGAVAYDAAANDGTYTFQYTAPANIGSGSVDDTISLTVNGQAIVTPIRVTVLAVAPTAPTITSATPGNGVAVIAFTPPSSSGGSSIADYEYRLDGGAWVSVGSTSSPFTITGLMNGTTYQVELRAVNGVGPGPESVSVPVTPAAPPAPPVPPAPVFPPSAPRDVSGLPGNSEVVVSWQPPSDSGSFPVTDYLVTASPGGQTCLAKAPTLTCTVKGLTSGTAYTFVVTALNGAGWGSPSAGSQPVTPSAPVARSLTLFQGQRVSDGRHDRIRTAGTSVGVPAGSRLTPWIRYGATGEFKQGVASIVVDDKGGFTWTRQIRKDRSFQAYVAFGDLESNRVIWKRVR